MPTACLVLLRDMLLEQPEALSQTKTALFKLLEFQLAAVDGVGGHEGERKWGSLKSKLGLTSGATGDGSPEVNLATRSSGRIALSLIVHLYCCVESVEQVSRARFMSCMFISHDVWDDDDDWDLIFRMYCGTLHIHKVSCDHFRSQCLCRSI